jgi:hypothetical protein
MKVPDITPPGALPASSPFVIGIFDEMFRAGIPPIKILAVTGKPIGIFPVLG